jgi:Ca2+-binding RTX toxin-like protein
MFSFEIPADTFSDEDGDLLNYIVSLSDSTPLPSWLNYNTVTRTLSGTPTNAEVGNLSLKVKATDAADAMVETMFDLAIADIQEGTNNPETFNATPNKDKISAAGGNDMVNATLANLQQKDIIDGGSGTDTLTLTGGNASNTISLNLINASNQLQNITDTSLNNFEAFVLTSFAGTTNFIGGSGNDSILSGQGSDSVVGDAGADTLRGGNGNDLIEGDEGNDNIGGNAGIDTLNGGNGDDSYYFTVDHDIIIGEDNNSGIDTVHVYVVNYTLPDNIENLTLRDTSSINATGNGLNNVITGNIGNNVLSGLDGNDTLTGGVGIDRFVYDTTKAFAASDVGVDRITDFTVAADKIVLDKTTFTALTSISGNGFNVGSEFAVVANDADAATSGGKIVYSSGTGNLFYNQNGGAAGLGTGSQFDILNGTPTLTANDFVIQA